MDTLIGMLTVGGLLGLFLKALFILGMMALYFVIVSILMLFIAGVFYVASLGMTPIIWMLFIIGGLAGLAFALKNTFKAIKEVKEERALENI